MPDFSAELSLAKDIAHKAGNVMLRYFRADNGMERKEDDSPVTIADKTINRMVIEDLGKRFPADIVIGEEESTGTYGMGRRWICDPIDGTRGYICGIPTAMSSLALVEDGVPMLGVTHDPFLGNMYEAVRGGGAFCNGASIRVSRKKLTEGYTAVTSTPKNLLRDPSYAVYLMEHGARLIGCSGAVYTACLIAHGLISGYLQANLNAHDVAAAHIIVEEAGGTVTGYDGGTLDYSRPFRGAVFSNGVIHEELLASVRAKDGV